MFKPKPNSAARFKAITGSKGKPGKPNPFDKFKKKPKPGALGKGLNGLEAALSGGV